MAWMNQERKAILAAELKKVMPKDWKYTLSVRHHSTIVLTITAAPIDIMAEYNRNVTESWARHRPGDVYHPETYTQLNCYHLENQFTGELLKTFQRIDAALNVGNHDRSDIQTDYFDVGWYVDINIGKWDKPFQVIAPISTPSEPKPGDAEYEALRLKIEAMQAKVNKFCAQSVPTRKSDLDKCWLVKNPASC